MQGQKKIAIIFAKNRGSTTCQTRRNRGGNFEHCGIFAAKQSKNRGEFAANTICLQCYKLDFIFSLTLPFDWLMSREDVISTYNLTQAEGGHIKQDMA